MQGKARSIAGTPGMCRSIGRFHPGRLTAAGLLVAPLGTVHANAGDYGTPRTSEGHPDLSGVWDFRTLTPLEQSVAGSE